jgi:hypothetical protein
MSAKLKTENLRMGESCRWPFRETRLEQRQVFQGGRVGVHRRAVRAGGEGTGRAGFVALAWEKIHTLLGSCRRHGINPFDYLKDLFTRLPTAKITRIREFTPTAWARAKANEQTVARAA